MVGPSLWAISLPIKCVTCSTVAGWLRCMSSAQLEPSLGWPQRLVSASMSFTWQSPLYAGLWLRNHFPSFLSSWEYHILRRKAITAMTARITEDLTESPQRPDLSLCEKCHTWNDVEFLSSESQFQINYRYKMHAVDIPLHSACPDCTICRAVYVAAKTRLERQQSEGRIHPNSLVARNLGPLVMGNKSNLEGRIDNARLSESRLLVAIYIIIYELAESSLTQEPGTDNRSFHKSEVYRNIAYRKLHKLAPRFCLRHTKDVPTLLSGVEPWESPFFNVDLLKSWVSSSDRVHSVHPSPATADIDTCESKQGEHQLYAIKYCQQTDLIKLQMEHYLPTSD